MSESFERVLEEARPILMDECVFVRKCDEWSNCTECGRNVADRLKTAHEHELEHVRDPQRIGGTLERGSFEYALEQLREFRWQHATNDEDAIPYINNVARAHEQARKAEYHRGYEDGRCSTDAEQYAVALRLRALPLDGDTTENLGQIARAVWHSDFGWTHGACKALRDELVRLLGGVIERSYPTSTYDVLGNERHKAVCELRKMRSCKEDNFEPELFFDGLYDALGCRAETDGDSGDQMCDRLIYLLGRDAEPLPNLSRTSAEPDAGAIRQYDVLGNERHEVVCRLREWEPYKAFANDRCEELQIRLLYQLLGLGGAMMMDGADAAKEVRDRLIHLLGGDERNFSVGENYMDAMGEKSNPAETSDASTDHVSFDTPSPEDGTCPDDNETCPNPVQSASIIDELGNERSKVVCRLREYEPRMGGKPTEEASKLIRCITGNNDSHVACANDLEETRDRLIHLLGGDEPTAMEYIQRIVREHDRKCLDMELSGAELGQASVDAMSRRADQSHEPSPMGQENETGITDELRKWMDIVLTADDQAWDIADRIDEQFNRICWQHEAVLQSTISELTAELDELQERLDRSRAEYCETCEEAETCDQLRARLDEADAAIANWREREKSFDTSERLREELRQERDELRERLDRVAAALRGVERGTMSAWEAADEVCR